MKRFGPIESLTIMIHYRGPKGEETITDPRDITNQKREAVWKDEVGDV
jgi:hypothetical protein